MTEPNSEAAELRRQADVAERVALRQSDYQAAMLAVTHLWNALQGAGFETYKLFELRSRDWIVRRTYAGGEIYIGVTAPDGTYTEHMVNGARLRRHPLWTEWLARAIVRAALDGGTMAAMPAHPNPGLCEACGPSCEHCAAGPTEQSGDGEPVPLVSWSSSAGQWVCEADNPELEAKRTEGSS